FSKVFYPLRHYMCVITPTVFFIGLLLLIIGLAFWLPILLGIIVLLFILITVFKKGNIITSFTLNQFYLLMGLYSRRKDAVIWDSTSKKVGEE
ncbi:MAG TPA: glycosyl transferase family 2, partial [Methanocorpusculum sp.]|nr:glycosyl transferase family 2 [Methanocorpusculum sp.]